MRPCNHIKADGHPCNAPALRKHSYCFFHQQQLERRRREYPDHLPILEDRAAVQVAIMQVLDRLYLKTIDYKAAALMLYGLQLASSNLKRDLFDSLHFTKVDRYYGNANDTEQPVAPSKPAAGVDENSVGAPSKPAVGLGGSVPEAQDECSPARSAGSQARNTKSVPEGRQMPANTASNQPQPRKFSFTLPPGVKCPPERLEELERIYAKYGTQIKACAEEADHYTHNEMIADAPPLSRSDRVGNANVIHACHSEPSEKSLSNSEPHPLVIPSEGVSPTRDLLFSCCHSEQSKESLSSPDTLRMSSRNSLELPVS